MTWRTMETMRKVVTPILWVLAGALYGFLLVDHFYSRPLVLLCLLLGHFAVIFVVVVITWDNKATKRPH